MDPLFVVVTQLGDVWFFLVLLSTLYLSGGRIPGLQRPIDRQSVAYAMALCMGALGLTFALKLLLEIPRPAGAAMPPDPEWLSGAFLELYRRAASEGSYDIPSGHAVVAVAVYGGLALTYRGARSRTALTIAAGLAGVIATSRVAIGVHSLPAVAIGVLLGVSYLWALTALTDGGRHVTRAFLVAGIMALSALVTGGLGHDVAGVLGLSWGGALAWYLFGDRVPRVPETGWRGALLVIGGVTLVGGSFAVIHALASPIISLGLSGLLVLLLIVLPVIWRGIARPHSAA